MGDVFRYLSDDEIAEAAEGFLAEVNALDKIPIDVELLIERQGLQVITEPGMISEIDARGFTTSDWAKVYVDAGLYQNEAATRFTLAHELGHIVLHKDFIDRIRTEHGITDLNSAYDRFLKISSEDYYGSLEKQSDTFAGMLLVPKNHLVERFPTAFERVLPMITQAKAEGAHRSQYLDSAIDRLASTLAPQFNVDIQVVDIRIREDSLKDQIP